MRAEPQPVIDEEALLAMVSGSASLLREIVRHFVTDYPTYLARLRIAVTQNDMERLERTAHTLRGAILNFHAPVAARRAKQLERLALDGDLDGALTMLNELQSALVEVEEALEELCQQLETED